MFIHIGAFAVDQPNTTDPSNLRQDAEVSQSSPIVWSLNKSELIIYSSLSPNQNLSPLEMLPTELVQEIATHLGFADQTTLSAVSQQLNSLLRPIKSPRKFWWHLNALRLASEDPDPTIRVCKFCLALVPCDLKNDYYCIYFNNHSSLEERKKAVKAFVRTPNLGHRCRPCDTKQLLYAYCLQTNGHQCPSRSNGSWQPETTSFCGKSWLHALIGIYVNAYSLFHITLTIILLPQTLRSCWRLVENDHWMNRPYCWIRIKLQIFMFFIISFYMLIQSQSRNLVELDFILFLFFFLFIH